ncbi:site-specific DNA recombinase [Desulfofundulus luciae]|uniref:Site-specific DNA recombinase n=1 Tax=Desulfofundulus luciae TaxID=74702 RepID=A0ABU0B3G1_9FIRM|nr:site-specific DNA recombinase [Desulfofundulus luciae]
MLAVVYVRVSTEDQVRHGYSLDAQEEACRKKAQELGATRVEVYRDEGVTGEILERPGLQAALAAVSGGAAVFIVYDPDRLSRKVEHQLLLVDMIEKAGCRLEFVTMEWQNTPEGRFFYIMRSAVAELEKEKIKVRSRLGRLKKARQGLLPFNPRTYGYRYVGDRYEIDEFQASIYHRMVDMAIRGMSTAQIARQLNAEKIPSQKGNWWHRQTVRRILRSPVYLGTLYVNQYNTEGHKAARQRGEKTTLRLRQKEEWIPVPVPPLIERGKWELLQKCLDARRKGPDGGRVYRYYLSRLLRCGYCGCSLTGGYGLSSARKNVYRYYMCTNAWPSVRVQRRNPPACPGNRHRADVIEEAVWAKVREWLEDPEALIRDTGRDAGTELTEKEIARIEKRFNQLDRERERAFEAYRRGLVDVEMFERAVLDIQKEKDILSGRLAELQEAMRAAALSEQGVESLRKLACEVAERLDDLNWEEREKIIRLLVRRITVMNSELIIEARIHGTEISCGSGTNTLVRMAINLSRGDSIIRQAITPAALQPNPMLMVSACLPWVPAILNKGSILKATRGR